MLEAQERKMKERGHKTYANDKKSSGKKEEEGDAEQKEKPKNGAKAS